MDVRDFKDKIYGELASITKALSNPHRLEIVELLGQGGGSVEYIADNTKLNVANASQHLQVLKKARLVKTEKQGKYSHYSLASPQVYEVWKSLRDLGFTQNAEIGKLITDFRNDRHSMESITIRELLQRVENNEVLVLDVRPEEEYEAGHIPNAVSIPTNELEDRISELPEDKEIIAYCRGPLCAMADDAVDTLRKHGYQSKRLEEGFPEWMLQDRPVE